MIRSCESDMCTCECRRVINIQRAHSLHFKIISSQFCIVNVQDGLGIEHGGNTNLRVGKNTWKQSENNQALTSGNNI